MADEYLNGSVKDILEPMISALLIAQPEDPKFFMLHWLKNLYTLDYIVVNKEKEELENLRLEVREYKAQKNDSNNKNGDQTGEELKSKMIEDVKDNKENELENNKESEEKNNQNQIETKKENENENNSVNDSKKVSISDSKNESLNKNDKEENNNSKEKEGNKDLIDFSEESEN